MTVYTMCYVLGEGYTTRSMTFPGGQLNDLLPNAMPQLEKQLWFSAGTSAFLGTLEGRRFGCVRNLPSDRRDDNGRECFINLGFEAIGAEVKDVDAVLWHAVRQKDEFAALAKNVIVYHQAEYSVDEAALHAMVKTCRMEEACPKAKRHYPITLLVPEVSVAHFFKNTGIPLLESDVENLFPARCQ